MKANFSNKSLKSTETCKLQNNSIKHE